MTLLQIDLSDALGEFHPDDKVVVWSPVHREGARGQVVNTRPKRIPLSSGKAEEEVEPGPLKIKVQCMGLSDTQEKEVLVPDQSSVTLWDLLEQDFTYTPPVISEVQEARAEVREAVARVGSAEQVGEWAERSETAASDALVIKNSIPATVQSEVDTRVPPKVAEVIADDQTVVDAAAAAVGEVIDEVMPTKADTADMNAADQALGQRIDNEKWSKGLVGTWATSLDDLSDGAWYFLSASLFNSLGMPGGVMGTLQIMSQGSSRTALFISTAGVIWVTAKQGGIWRDWQQVSTGQSTPPEDSSSVTLEDIANAIWWQGDSPVTAEQTLLSLPPGVSTVASTTVSGVLGLPGSRTGVIEKVPFLRSNVYRFTAQVSGAPAMWMMWERDGVESSWEEVSQGESTDPAPPPENVDEWWQGDNPVGHDDTLEGLPNGLHTVWSVSVAGGLGLPNSTAGVIEKTTFGASTFYRWLTATGSGGGTPEVWVRRVRTTGEDTGWHRVVTEDPSEDVDPSRLPSAPSASPGAGMKNVPLTLTLGQGAGIGSSGPTSGSFRIPFMYSAPLVRWRVCVTTRNPRYGTPSGSISTISRMVLAEHAGDGALSGDITVVAENADIPENGDAYRSQWHNQPLAPGVEYALSFEFDSSNGIAPSWLVGGSYDMGNSPADDTAATGQQGSNAPYDIWLEVETPAHIPTIAVVGDSTSCGVGATRPVQDSWLSIYCRDRGFLPIHYAASGDAASSWMNKREHYQTDRWSHLSDPDAVVMALGNNDMGDDDPPMSERSTVVSEIIREKIGHNVYATTTKPRASTPPDQLARRQAYADWLNGDGRMIYRDAFDVRTTLAVGDHLNPAYDSGDGSHLNTAGYAVFAAAINRPMVDDTILRLKGQLDSLGS